MNKHEGRGQFPLILARDHIHHTGGMFDGEIPKRAWHLLLCQKGSVHVNHDLPVGFNEAISELMVCWTGNNGRPFEMKERKNMASKRFSLQSHLNCLARLPASAQNARKATMMSS